MLINIMGYGGSGKDEVTKQLLQSHPEQFRVIKFPEPVKRFLERCYGYPEGASELPEYRNKPIEDHPVAGTTLLDMLNAAFEFTVKHDPLLMVRPAIKKAHGYLQSNLSVINNDFRNPVELEYFRRLKETSDRVRLHTVLIQRAGNEPRSTDQFLQQNFEAVSSISDTVVTINNSGTLQEFLYKVYLYRGLLGLTYVNPLAIEQYLKIQKYYGLPVEAYQPTVESHMSQVEAKHRAVARD